MPARKQPVSTDGLKHAAAVFKERGGVLRMTQAIDSGIHRRTLYALRDAGQIEQLSRGLYRLAGTKPLGSPDLVTIAIKIPKGVICLLSALAYYELTSQIPHEVYVAIARDSEPPRLDYPPIRSFRFSARAFSEGIEIHKIDRVPVRIYSKEKTLADCFKYRNKIGLDTTLEALRLYKERGRMNVEALMRYADICRVTKVMRPYLEALL
jgi:predicted transcriptional regulator of viral defense system